MPRMFGWLAIAAGLMASGAPAEPPSATSTISVEPEPVSPEIGVAVPAFVAAVSDALAARGFTVIDGVGHAALVSDVRLTRTDLGMTRAKVPNSKASASAGGVAGVGGGVSIPIQSGASRNVPLEQTRLEIRIMKRGESTVLWQGTALTVRAGDTPKGQDAVIAADLAAALLHNYPAQPEDVVSVP